MPMFPSLTGMQAFQRAYNAFGPQQQQEEQPVANEQIPMLPSPNFDAANIPTHLPYDENVNAQVEPERVEDHSTLDAFRESVLHPPQREHYTYPKSTLNGLTKALDVARTPTDYEKNRVYVNGDTYQKARVYTDKVTGEKKYIQQYKQPGFMEQVMKSMPEAVSGATDMLNQPHADNVADWELKNKGLGAAVNAEANMALAGQRNANAAAIPRRLDQKDREIDIKNMDAETRRRLSSLKDLPESVKTQWLIDGRITVAEYNAQAAMKRVEAQQTGANTRTGMQQTGANARNAASITGAKERNDADNKAAGERNAATNTAGLERTHAAGDEARKTKGTPSADAGITSQLSTQQKVGHQLRATQAVQDHPGWKNWLSIDENGMVQIEEPSKNWFDPGPTQKEYDEVVAYLRAGGTTSVSPPSTSTVPSGSGSKPAIPPAKNPPPRKDTQSSKPSEPTGAPPQGYVYVETLDGKFVGEVKNDESLKKLNTSKYRVRK